MKLARVTYDLQVNVDASKAWEILSHYGDVAEHHSIVIDSKLLSENPHGVGADRWCQLPDRIQVWERIVDWNEGSSYTYEVYKWKNFPLKSMFTTFRVESLGSEKARLSQVVDFRLSPGFLTGLMTGRLRKGVRDTLLAYKHVMETGERNASLKVLRKTYKQI